MKVWRWVTFFSLLSLGAGGWLMSELGLLTSTRVEASDKASLELEGLQKALLERQKKFQEKEEALDKRQRALEERERVMTEQLARYERALKDLKAKSAELDTFRDNRLDSFRQVYERMEPKRAAKILDEIELELASGILAGMRSDRAAEILGRMSSERAKHITERFLGKKVSNKPEVVAAAPTSDSKGGE